MKEYGLDENRLDATYAIGENLSGSDCIRARYSTGWRAAARGALRIWLRPHRFFRAAGLAARPKHAAASLVWPLGPRGAALFHGLNQRLPAMRLRAAVVTFHDLFVMTAIIRRRNFAPASPPRRETRRGEPT